MDNEAEKQIAVSIGYYTLCKVMIEHAERQGDTEWLRSPASSLYRDFMAAFEEYYDVMFIVDWDKLSKDIYIKQRQQTVIQMLENGERVTIPIIAKKLDISNLSAKSIINNITNLVPIYEEGNGEFKLLRR